MVRGESKRLALLHTALHYSNYVQIGERFVPKQGTWEYVGPELSSRIPPISGARCYTNLFVRLALRIIGGGADKLGHEASKTFRINGGEANVMRSLYAYVNSRDPPISPLPNPETIAEEIFGTNNHIPFLFGINMEMIYRINPHTSAGIYQSRGVVLKGKNRLGTVMQQIDSWRRIHARWISGRLDPCDVPHLIWSLGTRGKLIHMDEIEDKIKERKSLCRTISVAEPIEHYLYFPLYHILSSILRLRLKDESAIVMIGVKKKGQDWVRLCEHLEGFDYVLCLDWSNFDASVPGFLLEHVWKVMEFAVRKNTPNESKMHVENYLHNCKLFFYNNFIRSIYVVRSFIVTVLRGVPSGSLLTSIVGSIVNYVIIRCVIDLQKYNITDVSIRVYGDDSLVCFNTLHDTPLVYSEFISDISRVALEKFGMKINERKTRICKGRYTRVGYRQPIYSEPADRLLQGTSDLRPIGFKYYSRPNIIQDYNKGLTHRVEYAFTNHPDFLMSYMDYLGRPINSVLHSMIRLVNPEMPVITISDAINRVEACVYDNCFNINVRNYGFHIINALELMAMKKDMLWHPMGIDIKAYKHTGVTDRDDDEILELRAKELSDLKLFYREVKGKIEFLDDERTKYSLLAYEHHLRKLSGWNDMCIEHCRNPKVTEVSFYRPTNPMESINEYRPKGLYVLKMLSYRDRNMGPLSNEQYAPFFSLVDYDHLLLVILAYVKGYFKGEYTIWDLKDLPLKWLLELDLTWYSEILSRACNDSVYYQETLTFQEPECFSHHHMRFKSSHILVKIVHRALLYAQLWITTGVRLLDTVMKEFYSLGVQDRAMEECEDVFYDNGVTGMVNLLCIIMNEMIEYKNDEDMYDILLHCGWACIRRKILGSGCDLDKYATNFNGLLTYIL